MDKEEIKEEIRSFSLANAIKYNGKADIGAVMSKIMGNNPELRQQANEIKELIKEEIKEINSLSIKKQKKILKQKKPSLLEKEKKEEKNLPELPGEKENVRMRFAPNPSGPLHIGHARAVILNHEYVKRYDGDFILRIEDTDPNRVYLPAYKMIEQDLNYLNAEPDEKIIQGERMTKYYEIAEKLIEKNKAYVCNCSQKEFKELRRKGKPCDCRNNTNNVNQEKWKKMLKGEYQEGDIVLRIKTDLSHPDPAIRDWPAFRVVEKKHPKYGDEFNTYPLMNFSVAVDDHLLEISHVIRGKDHIPSEKRQKYVFDYMNWQYPEYIHHGTLRIKDVKLSTREIKEGIKEKKYSGWDDIKLGTIRALKKRGIQPKAIREAMKQLGVSEVDAEFSWKNLYSENRKIIDKEANRYFFVPDPIKIKIKDAPKKVAEPPLHPEKKEKRKISVEKDPYIFIPKEELSKFRINQEIRLKNLYNIKLTNKSPNEAKYIGNKLNNLNKMEIIQWVPRDHLEMKILKKNESINGFVEENAKNLQKEEIVQLERYGFIKINSKKPLIGCFAHR